MAESTRKSPLIAVDSNVLLDRADDNELVIEFPRLKLLLDAADVDTPLIASPYKIVHQFF